MTKDSTITNHPIAKSQKNQPRKTSIDFIRQFSRTYTVLAGIAINGMICN